MVLERLRPEKTVKKLPANLLCIGTNNPDIKRCHQYWVIFNANNDCWLANQFCGLSYIGIGHD